MRLRQQPLWIHCINGSLVFLLLCFSARLQAQGNSLQPPIVDALPDNIVARQQLRSNFLRAAGPKYVNGIGLDYVVLDLNRWQPGKVIKVAFDKGSIELHKQIAEAASAWLKFANLKFDFGVDPKTGEYRRWLPTDTSYQADIRISFSYSGYWSLVGKDSINSSVVRAGEASMNFSGFDIELPNSWRGIVIHEFGHALGFEHEHQHPKDGCDRDFRWEDDEGYEFTTNQYGTFIPDTMNRRPGLYTYLGGPPNQWSKEKVDHNLRQLKDSRAFIFRVSQFDPQSIMKYYFPAWMFNNPQTAHCFTAQQNLQISALDADGARDAYPSAALAMQNIATRRAKALNELLKVEKLALVRDRAFDRDM